MTMQRGTRSSYAREDVVIPGVVVTSTAAKALAVLRIATGLVFLWAFLDKLFGLHYSTSSAKAWINGGSPTKGFLSSVEVGPLSSTFHSMAGDTWVNWLFMLGLLGMGIGLIAGVALRVTALAGVLMMSMMWLAEFPLAQHTSAGKPSGSVNPLIDYHLIYPIVMVVLAATYAGNTWGLGKLWARLPFVNRHRWALKLAEVTRHRDTMLSYLSMVSRRSIASLNYLLSSHVWHQDHNDFSHQDPGFIDHLVSKEVEIVRVYLPPDTTSWDRCINPSHCASAAVSAELPEAPAHACFDTTFQHLLLWLVGHEDVAPHAIAEALENESGLRTRAGTADAAKQPR